MTGTPDADLLKFHFRYGNREPELCGCGQMKEWAGGPPEEWEEHVADLLAVRVRAAQAQAWDEGWADGQTPFKYPRESNPYLEPVDEFQDSED